MSNGLHQNAFVGARELSLSALGVRQAEALGQHVSKRWKPDVIYTSPMTRCVCTGDAVARMTGAQAEKLNDLVDIDYGQWQCLTHAEGMAQRTRHGWHPGWRATGVVQHLARKHPDQTVVLVGHDSINRVILLHCLGLPLSRYWRITQNPCGLNEISLTGETFTIHSINESQHLMEVR